MKTFSLLCLLLLLTAFLGLGGCGKSNIQSPRTAANDFLQAISESRFQVAYDSAAFAFQAKTDFNTFRAVARELKLTDSPISCRWDKEEKNDRQVKLTGELMVSSGEPITVIVKLIQERGAWRVFSLHDTANPSHKERDRFSSVGKVPDLARLSAKELPAEAVAKKMAQESILLFNEAITGNNFDDFYTQASAAWQKQLTIGQLKRSFKPFIDAGVNLGEVANLEAIFDAEPEMDSQGLLHLKGHYDIKNQRATFALRYIFEFPYWKLFGLSVEIGEK